MTKSAWLVVTILIVSWGWPRNTHDMTILDGRVRSIAGVPVAGARVRMGFPISAAGGGDEDSTDVEGCFHLHAIHSSLDRNVFLSVEHPDFKQWSGKRRDAMMMTAMVRLDTAGSPSNGEGWLRPREPQDTALAPCREKPIRRGR